MDETQLFCEKHWKELVPRIKKNEVNGIVLQPLAFQALLGHKEALDEYDDIIGSHENDVEEVLSVASPVCCWLEGRKSYSEDSDFKDDYEILIKMGTLPDNEPDEWWVENG